MENFRHWRSCGQVELGGRGRGWGGSKPNSSPPLICQTRQINIWVSQAEKRLHLGTDKSLTRGYEEGRGRWILWSPCLFALLLCNYRRRKSRPFFLKWVKEQKQPIHIIYNKCDAARQTLPLQQADLGRPNNNCVIIYAYEGRRL